MFAVLTNTPFEYALVKANGAGHVFEDGASDDDELRTVVSHEDLCNVLVALGGEVAERSILGSCDESGLVRDRERLADALFGAASDEACRALLCQRCRFAVETCFHSDAIREAVERVAEALERRRMLTHGEIEELVSAEARRAYKDIPDI